MLTRRREYYVGRPRRRMGRRIGRIALIGAAVLGVGGAAAMGGYLPTPGHAPGQSAVLVGGATAAAAATAPPSVSPSTGLPASPSPSAFPTASLTPPCGAPASIAPAVVVSHGDIREKVVALTFDDGTNPDNTRQILQILERHHVNATFFPTGSAMERFPDVWRSVARANFPIGNHTYTHGELVGKCFDAQRRELFRATSVFTSLGIPELPVMRPPYELWDDTTSAAATAEGLKAVVLWNVDTGDWRGASAASIGRVALSGGRGSIILMHTFPEATAAAIPAIIRGYRARGFRFVTIGQMLAIDGPVPFPAAKD